MKEIFFLNTIHRVNSGLDQAEKVIYELQERTRYYLNHVKITIKYQRQKRDS